MNLVVLLLLLSPTIQAFTSTKPSLTYHATRTTTTTTTTTTTAVASSPLDDEEVPDEIARLIAKGRAIRQTVEQQEQEETNPTENNVDIIEWTDLSKLPEFKTKVPSKEEMKKPPPTPKKKNSDAEQTIAPDYTNDYADENEFHIPNRMGFTTLRWGDTSRGFVQDGKLTNKMKKEGKFLAGDAQVAYNTMLSAGITLCVSSEIHGKASSSKLLSAEHIVGRCMDDNSDINPLMSTTYQGSLKHVLTTGPRLGGAGSVVQALQQSCKRMETTSVELYQAQKTFSKTSLAQGLTDALDKGLCNFVGVVDMNQGDMKVMVKKLDAFDCALTSNQFEFSLTNRKNMALIDTCKRMRVIPLIRLPLGVDGLASGRYTAMNPSGGETGGRSKFSFKLLDKLSPLHSVQEIVAERASSRVKKQQKELKGRSKSRFPPPEVNASISTTQVAINYVVAKGGVPLMDVYDTKSVEVVKGCLGWTLTVEEVDMLDKAASLCGL